MHYLREWRSGDVVSRPVRDRSLSVCPDDHPHDLETCWLGHNCRCEQCRHLRKMERQRRRNRMVAYGRSYVEERVPVGPVRDHVVALMAHAGLERIADAAQVSRSLLLDIYFGYRGRQKAHRRSEPQSVRASLAERVLAVTPEMLDAAFVPSVGTVRRLQALVAVGYSESELASRLGVLVTNLSGIILGKRSRVTAATYEAVRELFAECWAHPKRGRVGERSRALAKSHRWVGPLAWDDIDDPRETPNLAGEFTGEPQLDEIAIEEAMLGRPVKLRHGERREVVRRLNALKLNDQEIATRMHIADRTVLRIRQELGLAAAVGADRQVVA